MSINYLKKNPPSIDTNLFMQSLQIQTDLRCNPLTTTQRNTLNEEDGMIIYNYENNGFEGFVNGMWITLGAAGQTGAAGPTGPAGFGTFAFIQNYADVTIGTGNVYVDIPFGNTYGVSGASSGTWGLTDGHIIIPETGIYYIIYTPTMETRGDGPSDPTSVLCQLRYNITSIINSEAAFTFPGGITSLTPETTTTSQSVMISLNAGDIISCRVRIGGGDPQLDVNISSININLIKMA